MEANHGTTTKLIMIESQENANEIELTIVMKVSLPKPAQTQQLPARLEASVELSGQQYKRGLFQWLVEHMDAELIERKEQAATFTHYDNKPFTFKTLFGKVAVKRARVKLANGRTEVPSHHIWKTPRKTMITTGLRAAVCNLAIKTSISNTQRGICERAGESNLLSTQSLLNILHAEGAALALAQERRARSVYEEMPAAKVLRIDTTKPWRKHIPLLSDDEISDYDFEGNYGIKVFRHVENGRLFLNLPQHTQAEGLIIIEADECIVPAQAYTGKKDIMIFTGVVNASERAYYFSAQTAAKLWYQIGALLAVLRAHEGYRDVLVLGDGAKWIRRWYRELPISRKSMRLCWYHLTQTIHDLLTGGFGYARGLALVAKCLRHLWKGEVMPAVNQIEAHANEVINKPKIRRLLRYLKARLPMIPNYQQCRLDGEWLANTKVEVFNHWAISSRCKGLGSKWGPAGVSAIAALVTAERNGELAAWWWDRDLPSWDVHASAPCHDLSYFHVSSA